MGKKTKPKQILLSGSKDLSFRLPELNLSKDLPESPETAPTDLFIIVAGPYSTPCTFDGYQLVIDDYPGGASIPLYDINRAEELINRSNEFRALKGYHSAEYRAVPVFKLTTY